jgi:hypothetical protein
MGYNAGYGSYMSRYTMPWYAMARYAILWLAMMLNLPMLLYRLLNLKQKTGKIEPENLNQKSKLN